MNYFAVIGLLFIGISQSASKDKQRAVIMQRPSDVTKARCGQEITMTCLAEGSPAPEVEWWYYDTQNKKKDAQKLEQGHRRGRVKIKVEEFTVVRSTVVVEGAEGEDVGVYQCRASNSAKRRVPGENVYKHWRIEEAPVIAVLCEDEFETEVDRQQTVALLKDIDDVTITTQPSTTVTDEIVVMTTEANDITTWNQTMTFATKYFLRQMKTTEVSMTTTDGAKSNRSVFYLLVFSLIVSSYAFCEL